MFGKPRKQRVIAWRVDAPGVQPPAGQPFFTSGVPAQPQQRAADDVTVPLRETMERQTREARISVWRGIRRRLAGQGQSLPEPSREVMDRLLSEVEQTLGKDR